MHVCFPLGERLLVTPKLCEGGQVSLLRFGFVSAASLRRTLFLNRRSSPRLRRFSLPAFVNAVVSSTPEVSARSRSKLCPVSRVKSASPAIHEIAGFLVPDRNDSARNRFADRRNFYFDAHPRLTKRRKNARSNQTLMTSTSCSFCIGTALKHRCRSKTALNDVKRVANERRLARVCDARASRRPDWRWRRDRRKRSRDRTIFAAAAR